MTNNFRWHFFAASSSVSCPDVSSQWVPDRWFSHGKRFVTQMQMSS